MTDLEFQYIKRAVEVLESGEASDMTRAKVLQTVSEITGRAAKEIREDLWARVDEAMQEYQGA